jgi:hypothetical protein
LEIADMLLDKGMILYIEDKKGNRDEYYAENGMAWDRPIVLLVDGNSASASEVLSGALKDHKRATLVGTTTFGKGIVQNLRTLKDGSALKLTISAYYTPSGATVHEEGIEPDVVVEFDAEAYNKQLMEKITIIGDIIFFGTSSQYMDISKYPTEIQRKNEFNKILDKHKNEYINLVTSLYGKANPIIYKNGNQTKTAIDLIKKLGDFNIRGNYHDFKKHHKDGKLGNEALSKEMYDEGIKEIETLMNSFRVLSNETINQKGGTIKVTFDAETKSDLKQEIDRKMLELYRKVCDKNKSISM